MENIILFMVVMGDFFFDHSKLTEITENVRLRMTRRARGA